MHSPLVVSLLRLLVTGVSVLIVGAILPGIKVKSFGSAVFFALMVGIFNAVAWYLLAPLTWPFAVLTLGIGILLVNAAVFLLAGKVATGVKISGWFTALLASIGVSLVNWLLHVLLGGRLG
jgi:putative membrane protein